ncbi:translation elongation factor Ts [Gammaproteobacteria bacterium 42_54_T18]|nr:translation elongation factor Ts [Gammaproteobacteria bacterium 42_54_T18]
MAITASLVKELRERTGLGMMECKKALVATDGDIEKAIDDMRKSGQAKADKKASRTAAEGAVVTKISEDGKVAIILEVNSETDFSSRHDDFKSFCSKVAECVLASKESDVEKLKELEIEGGLTVEAARLALVQTIGENIQVRRASIVESADGIVGGYIHGVKIGVLVALSAGNAELAKDVAMHVAAANPQVVNSDQVAPAILDKEKEIFTAQAKDSGKPDEIIEKMVVGRLKKFLKEITLVDQPFIKDPDVTVGALVKKSSADVLSFIRYEVGEGIEVEVVDFAAEVAAQVRGEA